MLLTIKNDISEISRVCDEVKSFCTSNNISDSCYQNIVLIIDEMVTNVILYAYKDQLEHCFHLEIVKDRGRVCIELSDDGVPFNPLESNVPDTDSSLEDRAIGGLGIFLVKQLSEHVEYQRLGNKNYLKIRVIVKAEES